MAASTSEADLFVPEEPSDPVLSLLVDARDENQRPVKGTNLVVESEKAGLYYLARYFSSEAGRAVRQRAASLTPRGIWTPETLERVDVWLPTREEQVRIAGLAKDLQTIEQAAREASAALSVGELKSIKRAEQMVSDWKRVESLEERDKAWLDTLPYPLASILVRYRSLSAESAKKRYETLDHFFEVLAMWMASIYLSATTGALPEWLSECVSDLEAKFDLKKPSFGLWIYLCDYFSSRFRKLKGTDRACLEAALCADHQKFMDVVCSDELPKIMKNAQTLRNLYTGHVGVTNQELDERNEAKLNDLVRQFRDVVGENLQIFEFIRPESSTLDGGVYHCFVTRMMGRIVPFETRSFELSVAFG